MVYSCTVLCHIQVCLTRCIVGTGSVPTNHHISQITWCLISAKPAYRHFLFVISYQNSQHHTTTLTNVLTKVMDQQYALRGALVVACVHLLPRVFCIVWAKDCCDGKRGVHV